MEKAELLKGQNFELYEGFDPERDSIEKIRKFADKNEEILMEPVINDYLTAEAAFCRMLREILDMTMERINF